MSESDRFADRPILNADLPPLKQIQDEYAQLTTGTVIEVYWKDLFIWRKATVCIAFDALPEGLFVQVHYPGCGPNVVDEQLNLLDKSVYNRMRIPGQTNLAVPKPSTVALTTAMTTTTTTGDVKSAPPTVDSVSMTAASSETNSRTEPSVITTASMPVPTDTKTTAPSVEDAVRTEPAKTASLPVSVDVKSIDDAGRTEPAVPKPASSLIPPDSKWTDNNYKSAEVSSTLAGHSAINYRGSSVHPSEVGMERTATGVLIPRWINKNLPPLAQLKTELEQLNAGDDIEVYWFNLHEWRTAKILICWNAEPEGLFVRGRFTGYESNMYEEEWNLLNKTQYNRLRRPGQSNLSVGPVRLADDATGRPSTTALAKSDVIPATAPVDCKTAALTGQPTITPAKSVLIPPTAAIDCKTAAATDQPTVTTSKPDLIPATAPTDAKTAASTGQPTITPAKSDLIPATAPTDRKKSAVAVVDTEPPATKSTDDATEMTPLLPQTGDDAVCIRRRRSIINSNQTAANDSTEPLESDPLLVEKPLPDPPSADKPKSGGWFSFWS